LVTREIEIDEDNVCWMEVKEDYDDPLNNNYLGDFPLPPPLFEEPSPSTEEKIETTTLYFEATPLNISEKEVTITTTANVDESPAKKKPKTRRIFSRKTPCQYCPAVLENRTQLRDHIHFTHRYMNPPPPPSEHNKRLPCPSCERIFPSELYLRVHIDVDHGDPEQYPNAYKRKCEDENCGMVFTKASKFYNHNHNCLSGEKFSSLEEMRSEARKEGGNCTHTIQNNFSEQKKNQFKVNCNYCDEVFTDREKFKGHKVAVHGAGSKKDGHYQCEYCLKFYMRSSALRFHQRSIHLDCPLHLRRKAKASSGSSEELSLPVKVETIKCHVRKESEICSSVIELKEHERTEELGKEVKAKIAIHRNVCRESFNGNSKALKDHLENERHAKEVQSFRQFKAAEF